MQSLGNVMLIRNGFPSSECERKSTSIFTFGSGFSTLFTASLSFPSRALSSPTVFLVSSSAAASTFPSCTKQLLTNSFFLVSCSDLLLSPRPLFTSLSPPAVLLQLSPKNCLCRASAMLVVKVLPHFEHSEFF